MVSIWHFILVTHSIHNTLSYPFQFYRSSTNDHYTMVYKNNVTREILDDGTFSLLKSFDDRPTYSILDEEERKKMKSLPAIDSLPMKNSLPDERMRTYIQGIEVLEPPQFYWDCKDSIYFPGLMNPSLTKWRGKILVSFRTNLDSSKLGFAWMKDDLTGIDHELDYLGINSSSTFSLVKELWFNNLQEDPRLMVLSDNRLLITYSVYLGNRPHGHFKQAMLFGDVINNRLVFEDSLYLDHSNMGSDQKNWTPLEHKGKIYLIQSIDPLHILEYVGRGDDDRAKLTTVTNEEKLAVNPWKGWYGWPIRGGTPAILVRGHYLSIFHTLCMFQFPYKLRTYFMGAITFCPDQPFNIHSVSRYPIANYTMWYTQPWVNIKLDYVVFPTGLMISDDNQSLYISLGHQDKDSYIIKVSITHLLESMDVIHPCGETDSDAPQVDNTIQDDIYDEEKHHKSPHHVKENISAHEIFDHEDGNPILSDEKKAIHEKANLRHHDIPPHSESNPLKDILRSRI